MKLNIDDYTLEELQEAVRKKENDEQPKKKAIIDFEPLVQQCIQHIEDLSKGENRDDDDHYMYETAMECVFGENVWSWVNEKLS